MEKPLNNSQFARSFAAYGSWLNMMQRCYNTNYARYHEWGGRGIQVCARWRFSFWLFLADMGERPDGMTLERKNNEGHYEPSNCKWASRMEQRHNQSKLTVMAQLDKAIQ